MTYRMGIVGLAMLTGGCAALPTPQTLRGVSVNAIVDRTKCELATMIGPNYDKSLGEWSAKVTLDLRVLYDNSGGPSLAAVIPYHAGFVDLTGSLGGAAQSNRAGHLSYNVAKLKDLADIPCDLYTGLPQAPDDLGLAHWLRTAVSSVSRLNDKVELNELTYTLEFVIEQSATGEVRVRSVGHPTTGSAALGGKASAKDTNTLLVTLVKPASPPSASLIKIVNWPSVLRQSEEKKVEKPARHRRDRVKKGRKPAAIRPLDFNQPRTPPRTLDPYTQQRLDDVQVKQRLFNSITVPRSTLNAF